jgi:hypothetical protein
MATTVRIIHLSGPLKGRTQDFNGDVKSILFGREQEADVAYPASLTTLGRKHFRLARGDGGFTVALIGSNHNVEVDGNPAEPGVPVRSGAVLRLAGKNGPTFEVRFNEAIAADDPFRTVATERRKSAFEQIGGLRRRVALGAGIGLVLFGGIFAALWWFYQREASLDDQLAELGERAKASFAAKDIDRLLGAAYAVIEQVPASGTKPKQERTVATAWPVKDGLFVTNAHVALAIEAGGDRKYFIRPRGATDGGFEVLKPLPHPAYQRFFSFLDENKDRLGAFVSGKGYQLFNPVGAYDVALLAVTPGKDPLRLLPLAGADEIKALKPGAALAYAGYPVEGTVGEFTSQVQLNPELKYGNVTALSDFFMFPAGADKNQLIHHSIPITGGASGGPIIDQDGHVVAILSGGNVAASDRVNPDTKAVEKQRTPSAVLINFAQRADLLAELLSQADAPAGPDPTVAAYWQAQTDKFASWDRYLGEKIAAFRASFADQAGEPGSEEKVCDKCSLGEGETKTAGPLIRRSVTYAVKAKATYGFIAHAAPNDRIAIGAYSGGKLIGYDDENRNGVPYLIFQAPADGQVEIRVFGPSDDDVTYTLYEFSGERKPVAAGSIGAD